ncbi:hypothetical protein [Kribbella sp. NPDC049227]|uniref:hypothetical protein n=1 Tax=Kribbella sp. NPDC049227 TaxID=3364113 RepID=UPI00371010C3
MSKVNQRSTPEPTAEGRPPSAVDNLSKPLPVRAPRSRTAWVRRLLHRGKPDASS